MSARRFPRCGSTRVARLLYWRFVVQAVFEKVVIRPAGKGRRFTPERVELVPRPEYPGADYPVLPDEEGAA
ncbi:MAG: hypothetical protein WD834_05825 [Actinomycetota bacterium]